MVNVDMIGRLRQDLLTIYGTRTLRGVRRLLSDQNQPNLALDFNWEMKADSDHYSFYERQIPILMFHTGLHSDYHRPSDDVEKLNFAGLERIDRLMFGVVRGSGRRHELLDVSSPESARRLAFAARARTTRARDAGKAGSELVDERSWPGAAGESRLAQFGRFPGRPAFE